MITQSDRNTNIVLPQSTKLTILITSLFEKISLENSPQVLINGGGAKKNFGCAYFSKIYISLTCALFSASLKKNLDLKQQVRRKEIGSTKVTKATSRSGKARLQFSASPITRFLKQGGEKRRETGGNGHSGARCLSRRSKCFSCARSFSEVSSCYLSLILLCSKVKFNPQFQYVCRTSEINQ